MKNKFYNDFEHYTALSYETSTKADVEYVYELMQKHGIYVPEDYIQRKTRIGSNFKFDFFISKTPSKIKWVPTRSPEKKAKFNYKPARFFIDKLEGVLPSIDDMCEEIISKHCILDEQLQYIGGVILQNQGFKTEPSIVVTGVPNEEDGSIKNISYAVHNSIGGTASTNVGYNPSFSTFSGTTYEPLTSSSLFIRNDELPF